MGAYLSEPVTDCDSEAGGNHRLKYGATSMQGWRVNQEDAHNCLVDFDNGKSFFAVYDGHGGAEVAKYTSEHFPEFVKSLPLWKEGKLEECFPDAFIQFDDTLRSDEVIEQLKVIAGKKTEDEDGSEDGEDKRALIEEACMPLEQILKKYGLTVRHDDSDGPTTKKQQKFLSPNLRGHGKKSKKHSNSTENSKNGVNDGVKTKLEMDEVEEVHPAAVDESEDEKKNASKRLRQNLPDTPPSPISQPPKRFKGLNPSDSVVVNGHGQQQNGGGGGGGGDDDLPTFRRHCFSESQSSTKTKADAAQARERTASGNSEDGRIKSAEQTLLTSPRQRNSKSESEAQDIAKSEEQQAAAAHRSEMAEIASDVAAAGISRTTETPETQTAASSDDEHSADEDYKEGEDAPDHDDQDDTTSDGTDDSSEVEEDDVEGMEEDDDEGDDDEHMFPVPSGDTPGQDSGTTACVAVIVDNRLIVANAGDSRCVLSRGGVAVDLSQDHKPEDDVEKKRIEAAGGCISADGRVNGGLNLSRALGDHFYKRNEAIPLKDQMISALPDVRVETLTDADHFIVLACDGIWNSMTSQEVVDFVGDRLAKDNMPLQKICEEMCNNCLSPSTAGDGTGCDNMTVIIIKLTK